MHVKQVYKTWKNEINHSPRQNILALYSVLVQVRFITSKTKLDIYYNKLCMRLLALRVAEGFKI